MYFMIQLTKHSELESDFLLSFQSSFPANKRLAPALLASLAIIPAAAIPNSWNSNYLTTPQR